MAEAGPALTATRHPGSHQQKPQDPLTTSGSRVAAGHRRRQRRLGLPSPLAFLGALAVGTGLRLWHLGVSPAWQWDEAVYYRVSVNVQHGLLSEHTLYGSYEP